MIDPGVAHFLLGVLIGVIGTLGALAWIAHFTSWFHRF